MKSMYLDNLQFSCVYVKTDGLRARARIFHTGVRFRYDKPRSANVSWNGII